MDWRDNGIILSTRPHGETSAIVTLLTGQYGRYAGLVRGARSARCGGLYQIGNQVVAQWRGRLPEHLGSLSCELCHCPAAHLMDDPDGLAALAAACAVIDMAVPEREPQAKIHADFSHLIAVFENGGGGMSYGVAYSLWERDLLGDLGFGLDLSQCTVTGAQSDLIYVSPKSGRAVSREAGSAYHDKLLRLPAFFLPSAASQRFGDVVHSPQGADIVAALKLTGYFLQRYVFSFSRSLSGFDGSCPGPPARQRLFERLARHA